jgi:hypothetical protein
MGTRSAIGIEHQNGKIEAVYCHWDGYLSNNGRILLDHYDRDKTLALVALGDLSSLMPEIGEKHDFDDRSDEIKGWCKFYGRDRGETEVDSKTFNNVSDFIKNFGGSAEYYYVLRLSGIWQVSQYQREVSDLFDALREEEMEEN